MTTTINCRTPEEIKQDLEEDYGCCSECTYGRTNQDNPYGCAEQVLKRQVVETALADIQRLERERRITVYNARTDKIILEAEGYMSLSNNTSRELVVTVKTGPNEYKKNYVYLNDYTMYVVEDITGTHTDPYHYKLYFHTEFPYSVEMKP